MCLGVVKRPSAASNTIIDDYYCIGAARRSGYAQFKGIGLVSFKAKAFLQGQGRGQGPRGQGRGKAKASPNRGQGQGQGHKILSSRRLEAKAMSSRPQHCYSPSEVSIPGVSYSIYARLKVNRQLYQLFIYQINKINIFTIASGASFFTCMFYLVNLV